MNRTTNQMYWPYVRFVPCVREPRMSKRGLEEGSYTTKKVITACSSRLLLERGECVNEVSSLPPYSA